MTFDGATKWAEANPVPVAGIVIVGGLGLLWWFGFFSSSSASSSDANMAAAYYAAEAAATTAATNLQATTVQANALNRGQKIQADAAVAINAANNNTTAIVAGLNTDLAKQQSSDAVRMADLSGGYAFKTAYAADQAQVLTHAMDTIFPIEMNASGGQLQALLFGTQTGVAGQAAWNLDSLRAQGYSDAQIKQLTGL